MDHAKHAAWVRPAGGVVAGVAAAAATTSMVSVWVAVSIGWVLFVAVYVGWTWAALAPMSPEQTAAHSTREDPSRPIATAALMIATVASIGGVGLLLVTAAHQTRTVLEALIGVLSVAASWFLAHVVFMLHYARIYYSAPTPAPVDFNEDPEQPDYHDFAYLAFTMGMTYQVSDTNLNTKPIRRAVLRHALLSYLLGAIVLACTVNLVSQLASSG